MIKACIANLTDLKNLVIQLDSEHFTRELFVFHGGTLGKHVRHILEFYKSVIFCTNGEIFYDKRERNFNLESNISYCIEEIDQLMKQIISCECDAQITISTDLGNFQSTLKRELLYVLEHSNHHEALIKIGLGELGKSDLVSNDFGVASSTKKFREQCAP